MLNRAGVLERAPLSGGESVPQHLFTRWSRPGAEQNKGFGWLAVGKSGRVSQELKCSPLVACCLCVKSQSCLRSPSSGTPNCSSTAWSRSLGSRVERHIPLAIGQECVGGPGALKAAPGGLNTESMSSALVGVCAHVALPYHTCADRHREGISFLAQASYVTFDI